jgi:hypothetical protein
MEPSSSSAANSYWGTQEIPNIFIEPEGSLPCSQEVAAGPYPEPDESSLYHTIQFL